jgi:hypothetical protein
MRGGTIPARTPMLSVVSDFPTGHGERDQCYRDHGGYRRAEHQIGHVNSGQSFEHAGVRRFRAFANAPSGVRYQILPHSLKNQLSFIDRFFYSSHNWVWPILAAAARRTAPMRNWLLRFIKGYQQN